MKRQPNLELDEEATLNLIGLIQKADQRLRESGLTHTQAVQMNLARARQELIAARRARKVRAAICKFGKCMEAQFEKEL